MARRRSISLLLLSGVLAGCGSTGGASNGLAEKSGSEARAAAAAAVGAARSVHMVASGRHFEDGRPFVLDLRHSDEAAVDRPSFGGMPIDVVRVGDAVYFRAPPDFFTNGSEDPAHDRLAADLLGDRWIVAAKDEATGYFHQLASISMAEFAEDFLPPADGPYENAGEVVVDGRAAVALTNEDDDTLYVSATGEPLPLKLTSSDGAEVTFDDWNESVEVDAPGDALEPSGAQRVAIADAFYRWFPPIR